MMPLIGPVFSSIQHKGYQYLQMRHTNIAIISTISVYDAKFPQSIATYLMVFPDPGRGSIQTQTRTHNIKQASQIMKAFKGDIALR